MTRLTFLAPVLGVAAVLTACGDQTPDGPVQPPTTDGALELTEPLVMPPEEAEVPPPVGQTGAPAAGPDAAPTGG